jgi:uncharacterized membrane protein YgcG
MKIMRFLVATLLVLALTLPGTAAADVNNFTITSFDSKQTLSTADPQGELRIIEDIKVRFTDNNHGILRAIPKTYKQHSLQIKVNSVRSSSGAPAQYTTYKSNGNEVLKIGDPNRTVTGDQQYTIDYTLRNVIGFYEDHDEMYWDVNGDQWQQQFEKVTLSLELPAELKLRGQPACFTGAFNSREHACTIRSSENVVTASTTAPLQAAQTLTYAAGFEKGVFKPASALEHAAEYLLIIASTLIPFLVLSGLGFYRWLRHGRDAKGAGTIVPHYDSPPGLSPLDVGALIDFKVDNRDLTATIIDLAVRKYIRIIESKKDKLFGSKMEYTLELRNADLSQLRPAESLLLTKLFPTLQAGALVDLSSSSNQLYEVANSLRGSVRTRLADEGYFKSSSLSAGKVLRVIGFVTVLFFFTVAMAVFAGPLAFAGTIAGVIVFAVFATLMDARTAKGVAAKEHIEGLKLYIDTAEKDRINKLQAPNAANAAPSAEPAKTVELFEKLLPYAMILGIEKQWAKQFESLYTSPPDWYAGNWTAFNASYLAASLNDGVGSAVNTAFTPPSSSGSSGMGGGGFSGGGGGGGGGGGW